MKITVLFFGQIKELVGKQLMVLEMPESSHVEDLVQLLSNQYPIEQQLKHSSIAVNQHYVVDYNSLLCDGDEIAIIPPVSGG